MKQKTHPTCASTELKILGDFWTLEIIQALRSDEKRFCLLERDIPNINPTTLTDRLKKLEKNSILKRKEETVDKLSVTYALTNKGKGILPVLKQIKIFAEKYLK